MSKNTIILKSYEPAVKEELVAAGAITPGMLLTLGSGGTVTAHAVAGGNAVPLIAVEDELQGKGVDDAYASGDRVTVWIPRRGDRAYMFLADDTAAVAVGDLLESNGAGLLQKHTADTESFESNTPGSITVYPLQVVAQALEAKDLSGSSGTESSGIDQTGRARIEVRIV